MGAIANHSVMFSIAYLTLHAWFVIARAFIFHSAAWEMRARGTSLVKEPLQSDAFSTSFKDQHTNKLLCFRQSAAINKGKACFTVIHVFQSDPNPLSIVLMPNQQMFRETG